ncbi:hypothetical protein KSP39_PZI018161 [Platanthera zijinensis]|uniref:RanBP2-type domain-containing protein n=1 Tax=Platanthera zijinensis TaxID=2320716 RepID=A0AAP0B3J0_9ASPA
MLPRGGATPQACGLAACDRAGCPFAARACRLHGARPRALAARGRAEAGSACAVLSCVCEGLASPSGASGDCGFDVGNRSGRAHAFYSSPAPIPVGTFSVRDLGCPCRPLSLLGPARTAHFSTLPPRNSHVTAGSGEASSLSVGVAASPGRWPCSACTYLNRHGSAFCEVCGTRATPFSRLLADDLDPDDLAATGSVFLPLQRCGSKRPIAVESSRNVGPVEKLSRSEKHQHMDLSSILIFVH